MEWLFIFSGLIAFAGKPVSANCDAELSPPQVVVRYGDVFSVNCSSSPNLTEGMGWESSHGGIALTDGISFLTLQTDSVRDWNIAPQCFFNLNDGTQCSKDLPVTVYKTPDSVSMPHPSPMGPMVEGRVYPLQCDIADVAPAGNLSVRWHKGNKIFYDQTFSESSRSPVNKSSTLKLIAHRDDNGTQIWCEAIQNFLPIGPNLPTRRSESHELIVQYPPAFDTPENETLEVGAGGSSSGMILDCTAKANPLPVYSWHVPKAIQEKMENHNESRLNLTRFFQFPGTYTCTAFNSRGRRTKYFTVMQAPGSHPGTTAGILMAVFFVLIFILGYVVYHKQKSSPG